MRLLVLQILKRLSLTQLSISSALPTIGDDLKKLLKVGGKLFVVVGSKNQMHATLISRETGLLWNSKSLFETHLEFMKGHEPSIQFSF